VGIARRQQSVDQARALELIDDGTMDLQEGLREADIVVLATPVRVIIRQLREVAALMAAGSMLMDLGSTKTEIVQEMALLPDHVHPLGGHPMCGKEVAGLEAANPAIYHDRTFILTPLERTSVESLELGKALARAIGSRPLVLDARRQDYLVGTLSHLPYMIACALVATADATTSADSAAWDIVAGGFRDTSRVAGSDVTMMMDILWTNRAEVLGAVEAYQQQLSELGRLLSSNDEAAMRRELSRIQAERIRMFP
jgi:prephenate dehydrogenase